MTGPVLAVEDLRHRFTDRRTTIAAVDGLTFEVPDGELYTLLGPSGCGKTTTLRSIAGLERPDGGRVVVTGAVVSDGAIFVPPHRRDIGMVFQSYGIWPHLTVFENAAFPLRAARPRTPERELRRRVEEALATVRLTGTESRMATQLSGGQQQRLALARAIVHRPALLLLDEPLSNLDATLRAALRDELASLQRRLGITTVYVTHDQAEALAVSDRIAVMAEGRIVQEGRPREIYQHPRTQFVAGFVGTTNLLSGAVQGVAGDRLHVATEIGRFVMHRDPAASIGQAIVVAIRPEQAVLHLEPPSSTENVVRGEIGQLSYRGDHVDCRVRIGGRSVLTRTHPGVQAAPGVPVWVELPTGSLTLVPPGGP
jgi:iron(III) transport system ATP-binding protein